MLIEYIQMRGKVDGMLENGFSLIHQLSFQHFSYFFIHL